MHKRNNIIWRVRSAYFTSIISITLVLLMIGVTSLLLVNANKLSDYAKSNIGFTVFLNDEARPIDIDRLEKTINIAEYSKEAKFVSKADAATELVNELGEDFIDFLGYNPLPNSIEVILEPDYAHEDSIAKIRKKILSDKSVKEFFYQKSLVHALNENVKKLSAAGLIFVIIFLIISIALINNTVRLSIYSKRFIIRTAQLVGATDSFIRKPFVIKNIISGIVSASLASAVLTGLVMILKNDFYDIISVEGVWFIILIIFILGTFITAISGKAAVSRFLKSDYDDLYEKE